LHKEHRQMVCQLSAILRLAVALDRRQIGAVSRVQCEYFPNMQQLKMCIFAAKLGDDCALELWSLDYKKGVFEQEFNVKLGAILVNSSVVGNS
jgi:exopolyphosphatase / guanosine-5'-triphosphate,3'-diphosphate pyrophosphatase